MGSSVSARAVGEISANGRPAADAHSGVARHDGKDDYAVPTSPARRSAPPAALVCFGAYLCGSLPFVHLLARRRGIDLARTGSGNVGGSNLWATAGAKRGVIGWLLDASKGWLPVTAARRLGCAENISQAAGICGVAGQCRPLVPMLHGGRGISAFLGAALAIDRRSLGFALAPIIGGSLWRLPSLLRRRAAPLSDRIRTSRSASVPLGCLLGVVVYPLVHAKGVGWRHPVPWGLPAVIVLRRLTAALPDDAVEGPRRRPLALVFRLLYDRNTAH
jgi:glycerol-3-phosphate acyltransferase PlsY